MTKIIAALGCWLICFAAPVHASAIKVFTEHLPPMQIAKGSRVVGGIGTEVVRMLLHKTNTRTKIVATNWARAYYLALNQPNVMIFSITRTPEREAHFQWVGSVASFDNYLWRLASRDDLAAATLNEVKVKGYHIAVPRDDMQHVALNRLGFVDNKHLLITSEYQRAVLLVLRGRVELVVGNRLFLSEQLKHHKQEISVVVPTIKLLPSTLYVAFGNKTDPAVVEKFRQALKEVKQSPQYAGLMDKWQLRWAGE